MAKFKKAPSQRQTSESLQPRALATTPIHRESILRSNHTTIGPGPSGTMAQSTAGAAGGQIRASNPLMEKRNISTTRGWRTKFCVEPPGDAGTCCFGFWVPFALYGKTQWRLRQAAMQEDALDSSWKPKYGCNGPCWAYWALGLIGIVGWHGCLSGSLAGLQRMQVRGTYGIDGHCPVDMAIGIFCPVCTLIHNDREVRAREGKIELRNNKKFTEGLGATHVKAQPGLKPPMGDIWPPPQPKPNLNPKPTQTADQPQGTSNRPIEMTQTNARTEIDDVPQARRHRGGYEQTRAWATKKQSQEQKNDAALAGSAQENHPQSDKRHSKAMAGEQSQTKSARKSESLDVRKRCQTHNITPTVIITGPEDSKPTGNLPSQRRTPSECSSVQESEGGSREHILAECSTFELIDMSDSPPEQETHFLASCTTIEEIQKRKLESHAFPDCDAIIQPTSDVKYSIAGRGNSTPSKSQELSYVHDFTDCPVDQALPKYYENQEKSVQPHNLADCIRGSSAGKKGAGSGAQQHLFDESSKGNSDKYGRRANRASSNGLDDNVRSSTSSLNNTSRIKFHDLSDCSRKSSASTLLSNNPFRQHSLADCPSGSSPSSTVRSNTQYRSVSGTIDSMERNKSHGVTQHRLSSCPTPIAITGNHASDDSQATQKPTNISTGADNRDTDAGVGNGPGCSHQRDDASRVHSQQKRRYKDKGKANENVNKVNGGENSQSAEQSTQNSLEQVL